MDNLYVDSVLKKISDNLDEVLKINFNSKIAIYGLDECSFAIQSLLKNRERTTDCYVSADEIKIAEVKRKLNGILFRYLKFDSLVEIEHIDKIDVNNTVLLNASRLTHEEEQRIKNKGWIKNKNYFLLYDWNYDDFIELTRDKKNVTVREIQNTAKVILRDFDEYCTKENLRYWVCGGTLLGTIRHKGFIPWDDDIDVFMPWGDYKKLIAIFEDNEKYRLSSMAKDEYLGKNVCYWSKMVENQTIAREDLGLMQSIHPIWIDIFPIIGLPSDEQERNLMFRKAIQIQRKFTEYFYRNNGDMRKRNSVYSDFVELFEQDDCESSEYVGVIGSIYNEKDCTSRAVYRDTLRMPFEDIEVNVPIGYQEYLENLYGRDWMEIPDECNRITHKLDAFWM